MLQQDLRSVQGYFIGMIGMVFALLVPIEFALFKIFEPIMAILIIGLLFPFIAIALGVMGLIRSLKQSTPLTLLAKIFSIAAIAIGVCLIGFILYIFIKSGSLGGMI